MIKLSPDVKVGCPKCKYDQERTKLKEIKELAFLIDGTAPPMKQTTLSSPKSQTSTKKTTLF